jgi:hypothetical protein
VSVLQVVKNPVSSRFSSWYATKILPTSAHSKGIGRQSEFSNRELAEKKFELVYGAATVDS